MWFVSVLLQRRFREVLLGHSAVHALDAQHERQNRKATPEHYL